MVVTDGDFIKHRFVVDPPPKKPEKPEIFRGFSRVLTRRFCWIEEASFRRALELLALEIPGICLPGEHEKSFF